MKRFDTFGEYMFDLLFAPLKKGKQTTNQLRIFFKVVGRIFDDMKKDAFRVRDEANVVSASPVMLPVHGQDRDMPRLPGEDIEAYRTRLSMKGIIAQYSGTKQGVLYALTALGYEKSEIEPFSVQDPDRWAEFLVYLDGSKGSGVNDLLVIDAQVQKVKEGSSKPAYGVKTGCSIEIQAEVKTRASWYPRCGEIVCGVFPHMVAIGRIFRDTVEIDTRPYEGIVEFPKVGKVAASEEFYQPSDSIMFEAAASYIQTNNKAVDGVNEYEKCSTKTYLKGGSE
jgi:hypothetical protein